MEPTISNPSTILIDKFFYYMKGLKKCDIIIAKSPLKPEVDVCKRIIYFEGDTI